MATHDFDYWRCGVCGEEITGETIVDPTFLDRVDKHQHQHAALTIPDIRKCLEKIEACKGDDEVAHSMQDDLFRDVLEAIKNGVEHPAELAALALTVDEIDFARWMA